MASIATFMSTLDGGMMSVAYPALATAFVTDTLTVLWVTVSYWVTGVGLLLTLGWLGDVAGRNRVFILGFLVFSVGLIAGAAAQSIWHLIGSRVLQGVGSSMILSNLNALIAAAFPPRERGKALGISGGVVGVGLSMGPLVGGLLLDLLGWRALFYSRVPIGLLGAALGWWLLPRDRAVGGGIRMDFVGAVALFGTLASFLLFVNRGGKLGFGSSIALSLAVATAVFLPLLIWSERRSARPIIDVALLRSRHYSFALLVHTSHYLSHGGIILVAPFFSGRLTRILGDQNGSGIGRFLHNAHIRRAAGRAALGQVRRATLPHPGQLAAWGGALVDRPPGDRRVGTHPGLGDARGERGLGLF